MTEPAASCGAVSPGFGGLVCDREAGHTGPHRGYAEGIDAPVFWDGPHHTDKPHRRRQRATE